MGKNFLPIYNTNYFLTFQIDGVPLTKFINVLKNGENFNSEQLKVKRLSKRDLEVLIEHKYLIYNCSFCTGLNLENSDYINSSEELLCDDYLEITNPSGTRFFCLNHCRLIAEELEKTLELGKYKINGFSFKF